MALGDSQDFNWAVRGWEAMSFFVSFLYSSKAAVNIVSKLVEDVAVVGTWDIALVEGRRLDGSEGVRAQPYTRIASFKIGAVICIMIDAQR